MSAEPSPQSLLRDAVTAAKAGEQDRARELLLELVELEPRNATAWLWLSGVEKDPRRQEVCLQKVLDIDPSNARARAGMHIVRQQAAKVLLEAGITAAKLGARDEARDMLTQAAQRDERNVEAWLWLSRVVDQPEDQEICYENVLALDPDNAEAEERLLALQQAREAAEERLWETVDDGSVGQLAASPAPPGRVFLAGDDGLRHFPEESTVATLWARYEDPLLCPACAAPTEETDRRCARCGSALWIKRRRRAERSTLLWILIALQAMQAVGAFFAPFVLLWRVGQQVGLADIGQLLGLYLGGSGIPPEVAAQAFALMPRLVFFLAWLPALLSIAVLVALYTRWPPIYALLLVGAGLGVLGSVLLLAGALALGTGAVIGAAIGLVLSAVWLIAMFSLGDDFALDRVRILLELEPGIKDGHSYLARGRLYASHGLWALAAVHFRRAIGHLPSQLDGYVAAARACIRLGDVELARAILNDARRVPSASAADIDEVLALLDQAAASEASSVMS